MATEAVTVANGGDNGGGDGGCGLIEGRFGPLELCVPISKWQESGWPARDIRGQIQ